MTRKSRFFLAAFLAAALAGSGALGFAAWHILDGEKRTLWTGSFPPGESPDVIIILGMGPNADDAIADRAELGAKAWKAGFSQKIIASGGQGADEDESEAATLKRHLQVFGVPDNAIVEEATSTSTYENMVNSAAVLRDLGLSGAKVAVATHDFHAARAEEIARAVGLRATLISTHGPRLTEYTYLFTRELLAFWKWRILGR